MKAECSAACTIVKDLLPLYIEDMVSPNTARFVQDHMAVCSACRKELNNLTEHEDWPTDLNQPVVPADEAKPFRKIKKRMKTAYALIAALSVVGAIVLVGLVEWGLKQPIRRDFDYYADYTVKKEMDGFYFYSTKAEVSFIGVKEGDEPLWFDEENKIVHLKRIIYCKTSPWEALFGNESKADQNWLTLPLNLEGRGAGEDPFPQSGRFYEGEYCDYRYDEIWYEDRDGTLHLIWSIND